MKNLTIILLLTCSQLLGQSPGFLTGNVFDYISDIKPKQEILQVGICCCIGFHDSSPVQPKEFEFDALKAIPRLTGSSMISGQILDVDSNESLMFATVLIYQFGELVKGVETDMSGNYSLQDLAPGDYVLVASYIGYKPTIKAVNLKASLVENLVMEEGIIICEHTVYTVCHKYDYSFPTLETPVSLDIEPKANEIEFPSNEVVTPIEKEVSFSIYPNPAVTQVTLKLDQPADEIRITTLGGQILYNDKNLIAGEHTILFNQLKEGLYYIQVIKDDIKETQNLIIAH